MGHKINFVQADTGSKLIVTCKNEDTGTVIDLTGSTVKLRYSIDGAATVEQTMTITNPTGGIAEYIFGTDELAVGAISPSTMEAEVEIMDGGGKIITQLEPFFFKIRSRLP